LPDELRGKNRLAWMLLLFKNRRRGHNIKERSRGNANAIIVTADGKLEGAADPRGEGSPVVSILPSSKVNI